MIYYLKLEYSSSVKRHDKQCKEFDLIVLLRMTIGTQSLWIYSLLIDFASLPNADFG